MSWSAANGLCVRQACPVGEEIAPAHMAHAITYAGHRHITRMDIHFMLYDPAYGRAPVKNQARMHESPM
jgi:hypothetical protein